MEIGMLRWMSAAGCERSAPARSRRNACTATTPLISPLPHTPTPAPQTLVELSDGSAVMVTVAKYQTPAGLDINKVCCLP